MPDSADLIDPKGGVEVGHAETAATTSSPTSNAKSTSAVKETAAATGSKRQRTLADMFGATPATKKAKVADAASAKADDDKKPSPSKPAKKSGELPPLNSIPFSPTAYQESFSEEEKKLLALECETMGKSWLKVLKDEIRKPYFLALKRFLWQEGVTGVDVTPKLKIFPAPADIYAWSSKTPLGRVRVCIIGQDPYHGEGQAHGLSFSVPPGVKVPPSLRNIYLEVKAEYPEFEVPKHGNLSTWAENGVLLLNTALTVRSGAAGSHSGKGWEQFTEAVVNVVDKYGGANLADSKTGVGRGVVFMAWGSWAAKRVAHLDKKKHLILKSVHPSPLSARKGFMGNGHFRKANDWLETKYGPDGCVDWCKL